LQLSVKKGSVKQQETSSSSSSSSSSRSNSEEGNEARLPNRGGLRKMREGDKITEVMYVAKYGTADEMKKLLQEYGTDCLR
jgi:hypothetical protein